jgi:SAM-dependent methyltransferase
MNDVGVAGFEYAPCPRCGHPDSHIIVKGKDYLHGIPGEYAATECRHCGLWFQNPCPIAEQLTDLYPADYLPHAKPGAREKEPSIRSSTARYLRRRLGYSHLSEPKDEGLDWRSLAVFEGLRQWTTGVALTPYYVPGGRLLDVGCGNGERLLYLRHLGWQHLYGIELVHAAAEHARMEGFPVECGLVENVLNRYPDAYFDVIVSSMVLEHLRNPFQVVCQIAAKLRPGGQFLFSTISRDSLDARIYGGYWAGFDFPRHMVYLRKDDIYAMLGDWFEEIECFHQAAISDFRTSSIWRRNEGRGQRVDWLVTTLGASFPARIISLLLAWFGLTCRVSFRCKRKF